MMQATKACLWPRCCGCGKKTSTLSDDSVSPRAVQEAFYAHSQFLTMCLALAGTMRTRDLAVMNAVGDDPPPRRPMLWPPLWLHE